MKGSTSHSLRGRLLWFVLVAILLAAVAQAITAYRGAVQQADALFDEHLQQMARSLRSGVPLNLPLVEGSDDEGFDLYVQIWGQDGTQLFRSTRSVLPPRAVLGFSDVEANGNRYRVYTLQTAFQTVQIAQDLDARAARARALAIRAVLPFALLTPLLMLAVWWAISQSLAPIERARRHVASRAADDFSPLTDEGLPDEVRPLVDELNLLFGRVRSAFDAQKNFVADAAHELRSPLTALKLQAQALRRADEDSAAREAGIARLNQGIDRAIHLVEQLLVLAREEAGAGQASAIGEQINLQDVVKLAVADVLPLARLITEDFLSGEYGRIDLIYSRFISTLAQKPVMDQLLPIEPTEDTEGIPGNQFIFEPSPAAVLEQLLPRYVATRLFHAVLEAKASEESSRMVAMKNATENAEELIDDLTLAYNKVRQSNITREMIEIATGARAR